MSNTNDAVKNTRAPGDVHRIDVGALESWLLTHMPDIEGPLRLEKFSLGQSNPTYKLITPSSNYVLRAKPGPAAKLLPSAHAVEREFKVMRALHGTEVPVPRMHVLCEDESVIGRAFYVMECVDGRILWDQSLPGMSNAERRAIYGELNRVIASLHSVDYAARGLGDFGRPGNYFERQIARWSKQYQASITRPIAEMNQLLDWLPAHMPASAADGKTSIVHGDFRLDNIVFHSTEPRVLAVLDWELSTLGHPLADFGFHCMTWHIPPGALPGLGGVDVVGLGIPSEAEYIRLYCDRTGFTTPEELQHDWNFYLAYNLFRIAAIAQGIAKRIEVGTASSERALAAAASARPFAEMAWKFAQRS